MKTIHQFLILIAAFLGSQALWADNTWTHYGGDAGGQRFVKNALITPDNVDGLELAWQYRTGDASSGEEFNSRPSSFKATPILFDSKLIFSTGFNRVHALDPATGKALWKFDPDLDFNKSYSEMFTSRGVAAWQDANAQAEQTCTRRIFTGTLDARLIAIDARTGTPCAEFGKKGTVDLSVGIRNYRRGQYALTSPVTVVNDVVVVGSSVGDNGAVELESGVVRGYDARSGELLWRWDPLAASGPDIRAGAANVWSVMSADPASNLVFLPTTSPSPDFYGGARPGDNRDANSVVALDVRYGQVQWQFQTVHHDLWDYDIASQPLLTDITNEGQATPVVVQATKMGHVFVLNRKDGTPHFQVEEKPVPQSDVPEEVSAATQPFPTAPPPLHDQELKIWEYSEQHTAYCKELVKDARYEGIFTPPSTQGTILFPGNGGGTNWGSMAADAERQIAVVAVNRLPTLVKLIPRVEFSQRRRKEAGGPLGVQFTAQRGAPYGMARHDIYNPELTIPCFEGPWGEVIAINLEDGQVRWRIPLGVFPGLEDHPQGSIWGSLAAGGPIMTSTGLVFIASHFSSELQAISSDDGQILWSATLPARPAATPMSYMQDNEQYVIIAAGGQMEGNDTPGDYLVAFKLPGDK